MLAIALCVVGALAITVSVRIVTEVVVLAHLALIFVDTGESEYLWVS